MLTLQTQIPTISRGLVRSVVKAHSDWPAFLVEKGLISASAKNADLIEFALRYPVLTQKIEAILGQSPHNAPTDGPETMMEDTADNCDEQTLCEGMERLSPGGPAGAGFDLDSVLAGVDQFLAPLVRNELGKALGPVIDAANKPAVEVERIVEVERVVEVAPGEGPRIVATPKARRDKKTTTRTLFPTKMHGDYLDKPVTLWAGAASPPVDPFYVVDREQAGTVLTAWERGTNVWLTGPAAAGKSTLPMFLAGVVGRPFCRIGFTRQTDIQDLVGGMALRNGVTVWEDGILIKAMRQPGMVILLDELTLAPAGVQGIFQQVCDDHRGYGLPTGEHVKCADGVVFVTADNTAGSGDEGGLYAGTNVSNAALVTRFKRMILVDYLPAAREAEALANHTACPLVAARHLADFVAQVRRMPAMAGVVVSLRQMIGFTQMVQDGFAAKAAFNITISSRMPATERAVIEAMADLAWNQSYEALLNGKPVPATPSNSPAAKAFGDETY